jgi:hypothetical protein
MQALNALDTCYAASRNVSDGICCSKRDAQCAVRFNAAALLSLHAGTLALQLSAVLLPASVFCIASVAYRTPAQLPDFKKAPTADSQRELLRLQAAAICSVLALGLSSCSLWQQQWTKRQLTSYLLLLCTCWTIVCTSILAGSSSSSSSASLQWLPDVVLQAVLGLAVVIPAAPLFTLAFLAMFTLQLQRKFTPQLGEGLVALCDVGFAGVLLLFAPGSYQFRLLLLAAFTLSGRVFAGYTMHFVEEAVCLSCCSSSSSSSSKGGILVTDEQMHPEQDEDTIDGITQDTLGAALMIALVSNNSACIVNVCSDCLHP